EIISTIQDATLSTTQALKSIAKTKIVLEQEMNIGDIDFRSIALKIKALNPDAVFFSMLPPQPSNLARQLRSLNYKGEFFAGPQIANLDDIKSASTALENTWFVTLNDLGAKDFYDKYQEEFHESTPAESILGYDSGRIISEAAESGDIHKYLEDLKEMEGLGGKYILKDHSFEIPARVRLIKDGTYLNN
ncbi:MAG: ABC transporter substrate-binding protein, partial [Proteobacteria bacterium]|nr:ABC transporter substrate-binding protein [Pseudomonadota bacterium]